MTKYYQKQIKNGATMQQTDIFQNILRDTNYRLDLFDETEKQNLRQRVIVNDQDIKVNCPIRQREIQLKPEELIRQLYTAQLLNQYNYPHERIRFEYQINFGRERKRADIVILDRDRPDTPFIIVEVKKPKLQDGKDQLRSYCNATGAPIAVWTNGQQISHYHRRDPNYFEDITDIPNVNQELADIRDEVLANAGVDVFEEVFKLIFTKLYDEFESRSDKEYINRILRRRINTIIQESPEPDGSRDVNHKIIKEQGLIPVILP